jgi:phosphonate transport system substrate-binding protein
MVRVLETSMNILKAFAVAAVTATAALSATAVAAQEKITFAVTDVEGLETLQQEFGAFRDKLQELTGLKVDFFPVNNRTMAVEAMRSEQADFVLTGPAEYVVIKATTDADVVVGWQRPDYFAQVVTLAAGPIKSVEDLKGKKVTFGSVGSTSQHLGPAQALADLGLKYGVDYDPQIIKRNIALEALIRGDIAAIGMNFGHLTKARKAYPDVAFSVVARGRDLPNDILVVRKGVNPEIVAKVRDAFAKHGKELLKAVISADDNRKYEGGTFLTNINDKDYDYVRSMYKTIGVDSFSSFVGE